MSGHNKHPTGINAEQYIRAIIQSEQGKTDMGTSHKKTGAAEGYGRGDDGTDRFPITIIGPRGKKTKVEISHESTLPSLRRKLTMKHAQVKHHGKDLVFNGKILQPKDKLALLGVEEGSNLHVKERRKRR